MSCKSLLDPPERQRKVCLLYKCINDQREKIILEEGNILTAYPRRTAPTARRAKVMPGTMMLAPALGTTGLEGWAIEAVPVALGW